MASGIGGEPLEGSIDEAAMAIEALMRGEGKQAEGPGDEEDQIAAQIEAKSAPAPATSGEQNTSEEAPQGELPADTAQAEQAPQAKDEPAPAPKPVQQAAPQQAPIQTAQALQQLNQILPALQGQLAAAFPDIQSQDDLLRLASEDPSRYIVFKAHQERIQQAQAAQAQVQAAYANEWQANEAARLRDLLPETADPVKGPALTAKLRQYAIECGYSEQQIRWAAATDVKMLHDAMQFRDRAQADAAREKAEAKAIEEARDKAKDAPPVQKPGVATQTDRKSDKLKELKERAERSGRVDDLALYFAAKDAVR